MRNLLLPSLAAFGLFGVLSCGVSNNELGELPLRFLWVPKEQVEHNEVFIPGLNGAQIKAQELTEQRKYEVDVVYDAPTNADAPDAQSEIVRRAKAEGFNGVAVSCDSAVGLKEAINEVVESGIPVMTFDSDSPESKRFANLSIDNEAAGALAAQILAKVMGTNPDRRKVAVVSGVEDAPNLQARLDGFRTALEAFPNLEMVGVAYCGDSEQEAASSVEGFLAAHPDLGGFFFAGHWPLHSCEGTNCEEKMPRWYAAASSRTVKTVAFDALKYQLAFVENGLVSALIGQGYWDWGFKSIEMLYERVVNGKEFLSLTPNQPDVVCKGNVADMSHLWNENIHVKPQLSACKIDGESNDFK